MYCSILRHAEFQLQQLEAVLVVHLVACQPDMSLGPYGTFHRLSSVHTNILAATADGKSGLIEKGVFCCPKWCGAGLLPYKGLHFQRTSGSFDLRETIAILMGLPSTKHVFVYE